MTVLTYISQRATKIVSSLVPQGPSSFLKLFSIGRHVPVHQIHMTLRWNDENDVKHEA